MTLAARLAAFVARVSQEFRALRAELADAVGGGGGPVTLTRADFDFAAAKDGLEPGKTYLITDQQALFTALTGSTYLQINSVAIEAPLSLIENGDLEDAGPPPLIYVSPDAGTATMFLDQATHKLRMIGGTNYDEEDIFASWASDSIVAGDKLLVVYEAGDQTGFCRPVWSFASGSSVIGSGSSGQQTVELVAGHGAPLLRLRFYPMSPNRTLSIGKVSLFRKIGDLTLTGYLVTENSPVGTVVGSVVRSIPGSTVELIENAEGRFALLDDNIVVATPWLLDFENMQQHAISLRERAPGTYGSPRQTQIFVQLGNAPNLSGKGLEPNNYNIPFGAPAGYVVGTITNVFPGSTLTLTQDAAGLFTLNGLSLETTREITDALYTQYQVEVTETNDSAENSPFPYILPFTIYPPE
jgi:hypothetical protein